MLLGKKYSLRQDYDEKLMNDMLEMKAIWLQKKSMFEMTFEPSDSERFEVLLSQAKYYYLFKEARERKITGRIACNLLI